MKNNISSVLAIIAGLTAAASSLQAADPAIIDAIKKNGGLVLPYPGKGEQWEVEFHLRGRELTDAGLAHLQGMANLEILDLPLTKITDAGLEQLKGMTSLVLMDIRLTQVTDAGLEHLKGLRNLKHLVLNETRVTNVGVGKLQQALPNCRIEK